MDNKKYLSKLEKYLKRLPIEDRTDAIAYYTEYLEDIGPDGASIALDTLGTPAQVAAGIMADYSMKSLDDGKPKVKKGISAVWFAVIGVFALPIGLPLAIAGLCIVFAVLIVILSVLLSLYATAIGLFFSGMAMVVGGFVVMPSPNLPTSMFYIGGGLVTMGLGIILFIGVTALTRVVLKGIAKMFNSIRYRKIKKQMKQNMTQNVTNDMRVQPAATEAGNTNQPDASDKGGEENE